MKDLIAKFSNQLEDAIRIGKTIPAQNKNIQNVIITGMGGSGIGGKIVSQLLNGDVSIPIFANSDYHLPSFADANTLLIISSYSGNTEETLEVMEEGLKRNCIVVCVTSGGAVKSLAEKNDLLLVSIPGGNPPRAMFAYSFTQQLFLLKAFGVINSDVEGELSKAVSLLNKNVEGIKTNTLELANKLQGRIPVLYSDTWLDGVTKRWCQQINENSKMLCWNNTFPEMNHNELVGWDTADNRIGVVIIKTPFDHKRTLLRMDICMPIFQGKCDTIYRLNSKGDSKIQIALYTILFGDWLSWYLSDLNKVDAIEIKDIIHLKNELSKA